MPIAVTLKNWNDLKAYADEMADKCLRALDSNDPDWETEAHNAIARYNAHMGR
jgi:hypothetical protein